MKAREAWHAAVHGVVKSQTQLSDSTTTTTHTCVCVSVAQLYPPLCDPMDCSLPGSSVHGILQARILGVDSHTLFQGIFLTQGSNPSPLHCGQILYHLSHKGTPIYVQTYIHAHIYLQRCTSSCLKNHVNMIF